MPLQLMLETVLMDVILAHPARVAQLDGVLIKIEGHALDHDQSANVPKSTQLMDIHA
jgi:hypothetical protein